MPKKRTKKQKIKASMKPVNTHLSYTFNPSSNTISESKKAVNLVKSEDLGSIKKDLFKSLFVSILILVSLVVIYWVS